jgi:hypothetical protein
MTSVGASRARERRHEMWIYRTHARCHTEHHRWCNRIESVPMRRSEIGWGRCQTCGGGEKSKGSERSHLG